MYIVYIFMSLYMLPLFCWLRLQLHKCNPRKDKENLFHFSGCCCADPWGGRRSGRSLDTTISADAQTTTSHLAGPSVTAVDRNFWSIYWWFQCLPCPGNRALLRDYHDTQTLICFKHWFVASTATEKCCWCRPPVIVFPYSRKGNKNHITFPCQIRKGCIVPVRDLETSPRQGWKYEVCGYYMSRMQYKYTHI